MIVRQTYRSGLLGQKGVNLIELLIAIVIVAILSAIAVPSYQQYVQTSRRADAHSALLDIASRQERYLAQKDSYTTTIGDSSGLNLGRTTSSEGYYNMTVASCSAAEADISRCFIVTATATGSQAKDTDCASLSYDHLGVRGAKNGSDTDTTDDCW